MESTSRRRHLIIHGHFYQPPRENPWTETIERQESAAPFHDWNDRIANECYLPNALSRRLDQWGRITTLVNNYEWISFNFGPTLISWIEENLPDLYAHILEADASSMRRLGGHGNAIAQGYNHAILPLATARDRETQIRWGIHDFTRRFAREPEGLWLPEAAVNSETLAAVIAHGIRFIILSPHQAQRVRPLDGSGGWSDVSRGIIPTGFPYRCFEPAGSPSPADPGGPAGAGGAAHAGERADGRAARRFVDVFFYDAPLSTDVSFNHLLRNGDTFAEAIEFGFARGGGDLVVIATDGEIYGHHEPFADMALSYLAESAAPRHGFTMTNFAAYLDSHEPTYEVELKSGPNAEGTAWSCSHGVGRWKENCGCSTGGGPGWNQKWRAPLRAGLSRLRDSLDAIFEREAGSILADPWAARNEYIGLVEGRSAEAARRFIAERANGSPPAETASRALALLEMERSAQLMFTSCGWFFSDISGIETEQILRYAARAIELAGEAEAPALEKALLKELATAASNVPARGTGADIYREAKKVSTLPGHAVAVLYAMIAHLSGKREVSRIFGYRVRAVEEKAIHPTHPAVRVAAVEITSPFTFETRVYEYLLHVENTAGFSCFVRERSGKAPFQEFAQRAAERAAAGDWRSLLEEAAAFFGDRRYTIKDLFAEDRERILTALARTKLDLLADHFRTIYLENRDLLRLLGEANLPAPPSLLVPAQTHLTRALTREVEQWERSLKPAGLEGIKTAVAEAREYRIPIDKRAAAESFSELVLEKVKILGGRLDVESAESLRRFVDLSDEMGIELNFRDIQNRIFGILETNVARAIEELAKGSPARQGAASKTDDASAKRAGVAAFLDLARRFNFNTERWEKKLAAV